ncbi:hypothetical protein [Desulfobacula sp.]|uniref:hypothetical protein n=1 Tax=Desulfobacula sp. TaxID=2593537 RepID=UPI00262D05DC|nr:hypothetical protein [Desulfobacula sp.]
MGKYYIVYNPITLDLIIESELVINDAAQMIVNSLYHADGTVYSRPGVNGAYERYFAREENPAIKSDFSDYVQQFITKRSA